MVNVLRSNQPFVIIFIFLSAIGLWIFNFIDPVVGQFAFDKNQTLFYNIISQYFIYNSFGSVLITFILIIVQGFLLVQFNQKYILINYRTYLPAFFYIIIASSFVQMQRINPVVFGTFFIFIATNFIYDIYRRDYALNRLYMAGFFVSLASLFWAPFAGFFLVIWIALTILRPFIGREWIVSLFGFLTPFLFIFIYYYVFANMDQFYIFIDNYLHYFKPSRIFNPIHYAYYLFYALLFLIVSFASMTVIANYQKKKIKTRKYFEINWWLFFIGIILFVFFENVGYEILYFISIPLSFLITEYFYENKVNWYLNLLLLFILVSLVHIQIIAHY